MPVSGLDYLAPVRSFVNFFGRYGTVRGRVRGIWNGIIPVAVVDRYRDDDEGSLFSIQAPAVVPAGQFAAFAMGSPTDDWELLACNWGDFNGGVGINEVLNYFVYTPDATYTPVVTPSPAVLWTPGLNTDWSFTLGSVTMTSGHNPTQPVRWGFHPQAAQATGPGVFVGSHFGIPYTFDPPLRVYRDVTLGFMAMETRLVARNPWLSVLYRIRPRTTDGPRTG